MSSHGLKRREFIGLVGAAAAGSISASGQQRILTSAYFGTLVMLKKKSFHSLYFDKDCRTLATSKVRISQCTIAFLPNNPSVFTLLLMNSSGSMSTYCSQ